MYSIDRFLKLMYLINIPACDNSNNNMRKKATNKQTSFQFSVCPKSIFTYRRECSND